MNCQISSFLITHYCQVEIPIFTVLSSPKCHIFSVVKWEINSDVLITVEHATSLFLILNPTFKAVDNHLNLEFSDINVSWLFCVVYKSICKSRLKTVDITLNKVFSLTFHPVTTFSILNDSICVDVNSFMTFIKPIAVIPEVIFAAYVVPVAVFVLIVFFLITTNRSVCFNVARYPFLELLTWLSIVNLITC